MLPRHLAKESGTKCLTHAQLVAVGSRGRGLIASAVLGSTGLNLLHHAEVPSVMICRSQDTED
jgi:nucleotide-binding universal stress UspA family protein